MVQKQIAFICATIMLLSISAVKSESLKERTERVLQSPTVGYSFPVDPQVKLNCEDKNAALADIEITDTNEYKTKMEASSSKFIGPRQVFEDIIKTQNTSGVGPGMASSLLFPVAVPAVFFILSGASVFYLLLWSLFECVCKKPCCMNPNQTTADKMTTCHKIIFVIFLVLALMIILVSIIWGAMGSGAFNTLKYFPCSIVNFKAILVSGVNKPGQKFLGIDGILYVLGNLDDNLANITGANTLKQAKSSAPIGSTLCDTAEATRVTQLGNAGGATNYRIDAAGANTAGDEPKSIRDGLVNTVFAAMQAEIAQMKVIALEIEAAGQAAIDISGQTTVISDIRTQFLAASNPAKQPIQDLSTLLTVTVNPNSIEKNVRTFYVVVTIIITILSVVIVLVVVMMTLKNKFHACKFLVKLMMLLFILVAVLLNLAGVVFGFVSVALSTLCYVLFKITTDLSFINSFNLGPEFGGLMTECLLIGGGGDIAKVMPTLNVNNFKSYVDNLLKPMYDATQVTTYATAGAPASTAQKTMIDNLHAMTSDDTVGCTASSITSAITYLNGPDGLSCEPQKVTFFGQTCTFSNPVPAATTSTNGNSGTTNQATANHCFEIGANYPAAAPDFTGKVNSAACPGSSSFSQATANGHLNKIRTVIPLYKASITKLKTPYDAAMTDVNAAHARIKTGFDAMVALRAQIINGVESMVVMGKSVQGLLNCSPLGGGIRTFAGALCIQFTSKFHGWTSAMLVFGPTLFFFAWCLCCGLRCAYKREEGNNFSQVQNANPLPLNANDAKGPASLDAYK
jgi:hypothetical protein